MQDSIQSPDNLSSLGDLADPTKFRSPICIASTERSEDLIRMLRMMLVIRHAEEAIANLIISGDVKCPCHLGIGQEAVAVGISESLRSTDKIFGGHRSHAHYLAVGGSLDQLFAEVLGKVTGCSKGMGGSMHLYGENVGFVGSVPIVGATIPIAAGAALALKKDNTDGVAVVYFGDGAAEEGILHETLNFAANYKLPVLFVCENNLHSSHLDIKLRQPTDVVSRFAVAHNIKSYVVDGNDICGVRDATKDLVSFSRAGNGPVFLEAITYRWKGHVGPNEDIDVGVRRSSDDLALWKERDPIKRLFDGLEENQRFTKEGFSKLVESVEREILQSVAKAKADPYPNKSALMDTVYFDRGVA